MPKIVDPEARRDEVVEAVFRVVRRAGFEHASLRNVAEEAGLAIGSVRHYFAGHTELMLFAMRASLERTAGRLERRAGPLLAAVESAPPAERAAHVEGLLSELLPLDERRRDEATVWLAFAVAARTRPELRELARESYEGMRTLAGRVIEGLGRGGWLPAGADLEVERERLCALIDGLTVEGVLQPDRMTPALMSRALRRHLETLTGAGLFADPLLTDSAE
ncbi:TetR/AcrR family transcriptional regulator [Nonomuraea sp. NN258]|uniref:TetR/AcrR family transcriptional regulator n=1 Tax=Nonomuraea antri TaxID=2730852 RepID=UPI0015688230|nr:TetR/AcrR family transcriptional regulator [Nonomuraea antri]NRQ33052.1 TetR/AcrR family transcriptional regulator [Nonomuraea antri]